MLVHRTHVTTLEHELGNDSVEAGAGVAEALLLGAEGSEVGSRLGHDRIVQLKDDPASGAPGSSARVWSMAGIAAGLTVNVDVEVNVLRESGTGISPP